MKEKVTKAIICAAGFGTRFLPITKSIPKEMLNIIDTPAIEFIIQEVLQAGIKDILIIVSSNKNAIIDYFDSNYQLEQHLTKKQKDKELQSITQYNKDCNIFFIRQHYPQGLGDAISYAKSFVGDEPFAVLLGDDVIINHEPNIPSGLQQCLQVFNKYHKMVLGVQEVPDKEVNKYGIITPAKDCTNQLEMPVTGIIEKPELKDAPSNYAVIGRYILTPTIFSEIGKLKPSSRGEIELTPALEEIIKQDGAYACNILAKRYDIGSKLGLIKAVIDEALARNDLKDEVVQYLHQFCKI
ncbi:UTP--glucose-1-phosphate uridylyltransferase [bacterium]|nr:UTP--glucose-1-phosphate uridylyltransferase [bacterium]MBP5783951.1 UTP--glucose-1-phosphate uridylyltransferase [bacterium]